METSKQESVFKDVYSKTLLVVAVLVITGSSLSRGQTLETCPEEEDCSVEISNTTTLHCTVGRLRACNNIKLSNSSAYLQHISLYPFLSSISIYKRPYERTTLDAFKFEFIIPSLDIGDVGIDGVKAEFKEAAGHDENGYYKEPVCRFFNFSGSSLMKSVVAERQPKISYGCIGIGIIPSVFQLLLTSVPTSHQLNYVITWQRPYYYDYDSPWSLWPQQNQLVAVATVNQANVRIVHVVFQPPTEEVGIRFLIVSLVSKVKVEPTDFKQVDLGETSVTFTDVEPGQYKVVVSPRGGFCDLERDACDELTSADVWIHGQAEVPTAAAEDSSISLVILGALLGVGVAVLVGIIFVVLYARRRKDRKYKGSKTIIVSSLATRPLEKQVTSYFCTFLSTVLDTNVAFTLPAMKSNQSRQFTLVTVRPDNDEDISSNLLSQGDEPDQGTLIRNCKCHVILQFSYQYHSISNISKVSECLQYDRLLYSHKPSGKTWCSVKDLLLNKPSLRLKPLIVTFVPEVSHEGAKFSSSKLIPGTISSSKVIEGLDGESSAVTDDQVTVMLHPPPRKVSPDDSMSLHNKLGSYCDSKGHCNNNREYILPHDLCQLYMDLKSRVRAKKARTVSGNESDVSASQFWQVALLTFHKAAENKPHPSHDDCRDGLVSEAVTIFETVIDGDLKEQSNPNSQTLTHLDLCQNQNCAARVSDDPGYLEKIGQQQIRDRIPQSSASRCHSDVDSYSNVTAVERFLLGGTDPLNCKTPTFSRVSPEVTNTVMLDRYLKSVPSKLNGSFSSQDSCSDLTMTSMEKTEPCTFQSQSMNDSTVGDLCCQKSGCRTPGDVDNPVAENCNGHMRPLVAKATLDTESCNKREWDGDVQGKPELQREVSFKSACISGYESNDTPRSDITQLSWSKGETALVNSDCFHSSFEEDPDFSHDVLDLERNSSKRYDGTMEIPTDFRNDGASRGSSKRPPYGIAEMPTDPSNPCEKNHNSQKSYMIYPEKFVKSIKPPEFF